jgi:hypothetical protein
LFGLLLFYVNIIDAEPPAVVCDSNHLRATTVLNYIAE